MRAKLRTVWADFQSDLATNQARYSGLLLLFILVYFGEVLSAKFFHDLTSPDRQFRIWWFLASVIQLIPFGLVWGMALLGTAGLFGLTVLGKGGNLVDKASVWVFIFVVTAVVTILVQLWRRK